jgi:hypothetical protein
MQQKEMYLMEGAAIDGAMPVVRKKWQRQWKHALLKKCRSSRRDVSERGA